MTGVNMERYRLIHEMLMTYKINSLDLREVNKRVRIVGDDVCTHYYIDGVYAFTVTKFTRAEDDWGVNGRYRLGISHKIEFIDSLRGHIFKEVE